MGSINFVSFCFERELWVLLSPLLIKAISACMWGGQTPRGEARKGPWAPNPPSGLSPSLEPAHGPFSSQMFSCPRQNRDSSRTCGEDRATVQAAN